MFDPVEPIKPNVPINNFIDSFKKRIITYSSFIVYKNMSAEKVLKNLHFLKKLCTIVVSYETN